MPLEIMIALNNQADWTIGDVVSLVVGSLGVLLALLSLLTQRRNFRLSGSRVSVELRIGVVTDPTATPPVLEDTDAHSDWEAFLRYRATRGKAVLMLVATNTGRMGVGMEGADVLITTSLHYRFAHTYTVPVKPYPNLNPAAGTTLEPHHQATWYAELEPLRHYANDWLDRDDVTWFKTAPPIGRIRFSDRARVRMELHLGNGATVRTPQSITIEPEDNRSDRDAADTGLAAVLREFEALTREFEASNTPNDDDAVEE